MSNITSELRAHIHAYQQIRAAAPDLDVNDQAFIDTLDGESSLSRVIGALIREYRQESTLEAAIEEAIQTLLERREAAGKRAANALLTVEEALNKIKEETGETPTFHGASYSVTVGPLGTIDLAATGKAPKPITDLPAAKKLEALYLRRLEIKAKIDQTKAEEKTLKARKDGLVTEMAKIDEDMMETLPSLLEPGKSSVRLPMVTIGINDYGRGVVITDPDVILDEYLIQEPPPPPPPAKPNIPKILQELMANKPILGAMLDNGKRGLFFRTK